VDTLMARDLVRRVRADVALFARELLGQPLWAHQQAVVESDARHRVICSGRQAGKSTILAIIALHTAFTTPGAFTLVISAGEQAARDLLAMCSVLASSSPLLAGSIVDDNKSEILLTNGSKIRSIPQSQRQARGPSVDLLVLDEACWIDEGVWTAAKFTAIARPESRIVMASTPWGRQDRFFAVAYRAGLSHVAGFESFHWPSTVSPLVDATLLAQWEATDPERVFKAEVLAQWVDDAGCYFTSAELQAAVRDYALIEPHMARGMRCVGGVDWGFSRDASTLVVLAPVGRERAVEFGCDASALFLPYLSEGVGVRYGDWVDKVARVAGGYRFKRIVSECNGVGAMPSQELAAKVGWRVVEPVHTTAALKEDAFGRIKVLLQQGRLILPRHPALLLQLNALEYEQSDSGVLKISVPERRGHDDLAMGLALALRADPSVGVVRGPTGPAYTSAREAARRLLPATPTSLIGGDLSAIATPGSYAERVARRRGYRV
jgi:hypothetical protein